ncbi:phosphogluconate dehydratase [Legionella jordanis]|uniref:Phosphogluconate dehydratase n=1 Tax=Legionella jordanis TaxID=456 RepID=A0A0W0VAE5_9GAMM|nr:phosphogluconate dehydratase [Legionella jordanis]KTD17072.1 phosphogluconate dehydratase [Legionella jordanis]RMX18655.1 phosphogluconate dehydratase [Legionella jordanis]VEH12731.1 phosphogluconate dehydratase [Legionella jordanis]
MHPTIKQVTTRIINRSRISRANYLERIEQAVLQKPSRSVLNCGNLAHGFAACSLNKKNDLKSMIKPNIAIVSAYNDMLSAHQPYEKYPALIKQALEESSAIGQFAGGVPAMCDGVTQGQPGMELSLMSRDVIAMSAAIALSHNMFDGGLMLGICDKIVPGMLIAALSFGHLPFVFVPAGPMPTGISNKEKARIRQLYAEGKVSREALLDAEAASYHSPGTCTFFGTANSNQVMVEVMGLHLPGASFVNPETQLRDELTKEAARKVVSLTHLSGNYLPIGKMVDEKAIVNAALALLATGGSTNHSMHLVAIARAAGIIINWDDLAELSTAVPLIARIYPNGQADINQFQRAGGMSFLIKTLLEHELLHEDVQTIMGFGLNAYRQQPLLQNQTLSWINGPDESLDKDVLTSAANPFKEQGGLQVLSGNLGRAVIKTSALASLEAIHAPAVVFSNQDELEAAFKAGDLNRDCVAVVRFQGPKACGMPELHKLTPSLSLLLDRGYKVALLTDGRMSGASGKVPAAIHLTPEAIDGGLIAKIQTGDLIFLDIKNGLLELEVPEEELVKRQLAKPETQSYYGMGRELFSKFRLQLTGAEEGASALFLNEENLDEFSAAPV